MRNRAVASKVNSYGTGIHSRPAAIPEDVSSRRAIREATWVLATSQALALILVILAWILTALALILAVILAAREASPGAEPAPPAQGA